MIELALRAARLVHEARVVRREAVAGRVNAHKAGSATREISTLSIVSFMQSFAKNQSVISSQATKARARVTWLPRSAGR